MSQVITIGIGGAGVNMTKAQVIQSAKEHQIDYDGFLSPSSQHCAEIIHHVLFRESSMGTWTPRSVFLDLQPDQIDIMQGEEVGELISFENTCSLNMRFDPVD